MNSVVFILLLSLTLANSQVPETAKIRRLKAAARQNDFTSTSATSTTSATTTANFTTTAPSSHSCESCPDGWVTFKSSCYYCNKTAMATWESARTQCQSYSADLIVIDSLEEWDTITPYGMFGGLTWIGLSSASGASGPTWVDNSSFNHTALPWLYPYGTLGYSTAQPCVAQYFPSYSAVYTNFYSCSNLFYYMCEKNSTTPVASNTTTRAV